MSKNVFDNLFTKRWLYVTLSLSPGSLNDRLPLIDFLNSKTQQVTKPPALIRAIPWFNVLLLESLRYLISFKGGTGYFILHWVHKS